MLEKLSNKTSFHLALRWVTRRKEVGYMGTRTLLVRYFYVFKGYREYKSRTTPSDIC